MSIILESSFYSWSVLSWISLSMLLQSSKYSENPEIALQGKIFLRSARFIKIVFPRSRDIYMDTAPFTTARCRH